MLTNLIPVTTRPRLLLVTEVALPYVCGVSTIVDELTKHFSDLDQWDVLVLAPDSTHPTLNGIEIIGVPCFPVPIYESLKSILPFDPRVRRKIRQCLKEFQPHVIMTIGGAFLASVAAYMGKSMNIPVVGLNDTDFITYATHYGLTPLLGPITKLAKWIHRSNSITLVSSPSYLERLRRLGFTKLKLWQFGINMQRFSPSNRDEEFRQEIAAVFPDTKLICLSVSRLASEKSIDQLVSIARLEHVTLVLVGDGPDRKHLEDVFRGTRTIFWGALYDDDLSRMYASADVFLTASRSETFGLTVLEAMASGLPCVVIDGNGVRDTVQHGQTGFICASPQAMAESICLIRDDEELCSRMSKAANQRAIAAYSWDASISNLNQILFDVANISEQAQFGTISFA